MVEAFQKGEDIHARTARLVFGAKTDEELKEARRFARSSILLLRTPLNHGDYRNGSESHGRKQRK